MKILYVHTYYMQRGGEDIVYENEMALMASRGYEVKSVVFSNKRFAAIKFLLLFFNPVSFIKVCRAITKFKPDVVHVHNWFFAASPSVFLAVKWKRIPLVHTIHNFRIICPSAVLFYKQHLYTDSIKKLFPVKAIIRRVYRDSYFFTFWLLSSTRFNYLIGTWSAIDRFICLTTSSKDILSSSYLKVNPHKIAVKPNFVVSRVGTFEQSRNSHYLYVGRLAEEKGVTSLLNAFRNSPLSLRIIGDGPLRSTVELAAAGSSNIEYAGFQLRDKILSEMSSCSALIVPSICYEQFGLVIIEALSCGTAVIASDIGAPADLIYEGITGFHFEAGSAVDLKSKVELWDTQTESVKQCFYENARKVYTKNFMAEANFEQLSSIYNSLLREKS